MSFEATNWVNHLRGLTKTQRLVLLFLADAQNYKTGQCNPAIDLIMRTCELSRSTVFRALRALYKTHKVITIHRHFTSTHWQLASDYELHLHKTIPKNDHGDTGQVHCDTGQVHGDTPLESESESEFESDPEAETDVSAMMIGFKKNISESGKGESMKVEDILKQEQDKKLTIPSALEKARCGKKSYTAMRLSRLWQDLNIVCNPGVFQKPFLWKNVGQMSHVMKTEGVDVGDVMAAVIRDWMGFGKYLKAQGFVKDFPDDPDVGFFLKHLERAARFTKEELTPSVSIKMKHTTIGCT